MSEVENYVWAVFWIPSVFDRNAKVLEAVHKTLGGARKFKNNLSKERDTWQHPHADFKISKMTVKD